MLGTKIPATKLPAATLLKKAALNFARSLSAAFPILPPFHGFFAMAHENISRTNVKGMRDPNAPTAGPWRDRVTRGRLKGSQLQSAR